MVPAEGYWGFLAGSFHDSGPARDFGRDGRRPVDKDAAAQLVLLTGEYIRREYPGRYYGKAQNLHPS